MLNEYKKKFINDSIQFVIFDDEGFCNESDDVIFKLSNLEISLFQKFLFLESYKELCTNISVGDFYEFPCINLDYKSQKYYFDFKLERIKYNNGEATLWVLQDFTKHYENLIGIQQERNENAISGEFLEMRERAINLERDLLKYQNEELSRIQNFKTQFYARLSHELRTPLQSISGLSTLINAEISQQKREEYLYALKSTSKHLLSIVNDVIDLSKIEQGKIKIEHKDTDLFDLLSEVHASFKYIAEEKGLTFNFQQSLDLPQYVVLDATKVKQILYNLLGNAIKFTNEGIVSFSVSVDTHNKEPMLLFLVKDTGIGVPKDKIDQIFNPYEQAASSLYGGSGLGLSIVKQLSELMGGEIEFFSREGEGTQVKINLPFKLSNKKFDLPITSQVTIKKVLIVDDDSISRKVLATVLKNWNMDVEVAVNGKEFINKLHESSFDLLIIDYFMPEMDGLAILDYVKSKSELEHIPVFMLTGDINTETSKRFKKANVTQVINKPVEPEILYSYISELSGVTKQQTAKIDLEYLFQISNNNNELVKRLIKDFMTNVPEDIIKIRQYYNDNDYESLRQLLHKSKTNMKYVGLHELYEVMFDIEEKIKAKQKLDNFEGIINLIEVTVKTVLQKLAESYKSL